MKRNIKIKLRGSNRTWFYFVIVARNGRTVAQSETYNNYRDAHDTVEMLRAGLAGADFVDETQEAAHILAGMPAPDGNRRRRKARKS